MSMISRGLQHNSNAAMRQQSTDKKPFTVIIFGFADGRATETVILGSSDTFAGASVEAAESSQSTAAYQGALRLPPLQSMLASLLDHAAGRTTLSVLVGGGGDSAGAAAPLRQQGDGPFAGTVFLEASRLGSFGGWL